MKAAELFDLTGAIALVTGASSGLGDRFARTLAANGAKVVCVARRRDRLDALVSDIVKAGGTALAVEADVTDAAAVGRAFDAAKAAHGDVSILINNAGIAEVSRLADQSFETWRRVLDVNLDAVYSIAQEAARRLARAQKPGVIINIASVLGFATAKGLSAYAVAKAGVVQLTRALALELAPAGIRANAIAPGWIVTEINRDFLASPRGAAMVRSIPLKRFGQTGDLDGVLLLLASDAGRYITGATYVVDGGQLIALSS